MDMEKARAIYGWIVENTVRDPETRGTPVVTNPMKSGRAEQEQKGVTTPNNGAKTLPTDSRLPARTDRVRSGVKNDRTMP